MNLSVLGMGQTYVDSRTTHAMPQRGSPVVLYTRYDPGTRCLLFHKLESVLLLLVTAPSGTGAVQSLEHERSILIDRMALPQVPNHNYPLNSSRLNSYDAELRLSQNANILANPGTGQNKHADCYTVTTYYYC